MAKTQKATLDPSKISGHCGRLRCCLRYEDKTYQELKGNMPNRQSWVDTPSGEGRVIDYQILTQLVQVQFDDGKIEAIPLEDITVLPDGPGKRPPQQSKNKPQEKTDPAAENDDLGDGFFEIEDVVASRDIKKQQAGDSEDKNTNADSEKEKSDKDKKPRKRRRRRKPSKEGNRGKNPRKKNEKGGNKQSDNQN
jgi:hypothetical protein